MTKPIVTIIGATGGQGGSVVSSFLADGKYAVRAITRNPQSEKGKALQAKGVEVVSADLNNQASLVEAFKDSSIIFAVTDFFEPFMREGPEAAIKVEYTQGINLAKAAALTPTLKHYIWSTLPNAGKLSKGKYLIPHFVGKNQIDDYIRSDPALFAKTTFIWVGWFASNTAFPFFKPSLLKTSGKYVLLQPTPPTTKVLSVGDQTKNVGPFVVAIANKPELTLPGKFVLAETEWTTNGAILETWGKITGKETEYVEIGLEEYDRLWPQWGQEMGSMMKLWEEYGDQSWTGEEFLTREGLGITEPLVGLEKTFETLDWSE